MDTRESGDGTVTDGNADRVIYARQADPIMTIEFPEGYNSPGNSNSTREPQQLPCGLMRDKPSSRDSSQRNNEYL